MNVASMRGKVSVCMAAYNGSRFIHEQISSILPQLGASDELIVVDDCSQDNTTAIVESFADARIKLVRNERNCGVVQSFQRALQLASGEFIFLSDQDDVWRRDKVQIVMERFGLDAGLTLLISRSEITGADGNLEHRSAPVGARFRGGRLATLIKNSYQGCTMAFRKIVAEAALPFPPDIPMHDSWIGLVNTLIGKVQFVDLPLVRYRRHGRNASGTRRLSLWRRLEDRWSLFTNLQRRSRELQERQSKPEANQTSAISSG